MSGRAYTKRNRPVTACRECVRRKQKCDRLKPCNICLVRNVPEKCLYGDELQKIVNSSRRREQAAPLTPPSDSESTPTRDPDASSSTLDEQFGYSALSDNAFLDLYKSINDIHVPTSAALGLSTVALRPSSKERYFKIVAQLPSRTICEALTDRYFEDADWYFNSLDRYYFERLNAAWKASALPDETSIQLEQYPRDLQHFPALLFQVLAVGCQFSPPGSAALKLLNIDDPAIQEKQSQIYSDAGFDIMTILGRQNPSIAGIEHDMLRMSWLKNCSRGTESWQCVGTAIGQAHDLELHLESDLAATSETAIAPLEQIWYDEYRRRVWARLFLLDAHMALVLGRPRHIHLDDCTVEWPTDCDIPKNLSDTKPTPPGPGQEPSSFSIVLFLVQIGEMIHQVMSAKSKKSYQKDYRKLQKVHQDVETMLDSLPPAIRPRNPDTSWDIEKPHFPKNRLQILSTANSFLMKLHRPCIETNKASRNASMTAALNVLDAQQDLLVSMNPTTNQHRIYGFSFYTIDAAMLLCALVINQCPEDRDLIRRIDEALQQGINRLVYLKEASPLAASAAQLLTQCYAKITTRYPIFSSSTSEAGLPPDLSDSPASFDTFKFLNEYDLPMSQTLDLGMLPDIFDAGEYFSDIHPDSMYLSTDNIDKTLDPLLFPVSQPAVHIRNQQGLN